MVHAAFGPRAIIGYALLALLVAGWTLYFVRRARRRRRVHSRPPPPMMSVPVRALPPERAPQPERRRARVVGWHADPDHMSEEAYWDGRSWTGRRRWNGESWVELERGPSS